MMVESIFSVPNEISFAEAIALTQSLLNRVEQHEISEAVFQPTLSDLVQTENGARGFFVTYLSDPRPLVEQLRTVVIEALKTSADVVSPLLVKNLVMSTAMAMTHRRNQDETMAQGSDQVRSRTLQLIQALPLPQLKEQAHHLATSIRTGSGEYQLFLERWSYDLAQKQAMLSALEQAGLLETSG
ncbi:hypothetical protein K9N68_31500 [Kovacikia minuta CCNUW1]|uniref:hypothetical protein n=1 Tax=Kovacikia minuta TaxID=2931930 RepID=UPI001CCAD4DC|nr:hypothetical protein [Kovacikia minuta]UBF26012.1 hypothetical protein K9N68_31500 [Kovacikia minuta CCNUW1]